MTAKRTDSSFSDITHTLPIALLRAREAVMGHFRPMLNHYNISEQQWRVMRIVQEYITIEATILAELACVLPPSLSRMLKALQLRGFLEINRHPADGRRQLISVTKAGSNFLSQVLPESSRIYDCIETQVGGEIISDLLDQVNLLLVKLNSASDELEKTYK